MDRKVTIRPTGYRISESHATGLAYPNKYTILNALLIKNVGN